MRSYCTGWAKKWRNKVLIWKRSSYIKTMHVSMAKIMKLKFELLQHPPYSPDLAPSDFFLFQNLKKWLSWQQFRSNEEIIAQTDGYFEDIPKSYFLESLKKLEKRLEKFIELKGDYIGRLKKSAQNNLFFYLFLRTYWTTLVQSIVDYHIVHLKFSISLRKILTMTLFSLNWNVV